MALAVQKNSPMGPTYHAYGSINHHELPKNLSLSLSQLRCRLNLLCLHWLLKVKWLNKALSKLWPFFAEVRYILPVAWISSSSSKPFFFQLCWVQLHKFCSSIPVYLGYLCYRMHAFVLKFIFRFCSITTNMQSISSTFSKHLDCVTTMQWSLQMFVTCIWLKYFDCKFNLSNK